MRSRVSPLEPSEDAIRAWVVEHDEGSTRVVQVHSGGHLPAEVRRAVTTRGKSAVQRFLDAGLIPPNKITLTDTGIYPPISE